jgi:RecB family endonuclease NucS
MTEAEGFRKTTIQASTAAIFQFAMVNIANYPNHLEDGLLPHPNSKIRKRVFGDKSRLDVLLIDKANAPVIVECKQSASTIDDLSQLRRYMQRYRRELGQRPRGILVHGGAAKLTSQLRKEARRNPAVEMINYSLQVLFSLSH